MPAHVEQEARPKELITLPAVLAEIPDAVDFAKLEAETSAMAKTPEGTFALTYLLAARNILKPILTETHVSRDLMQPTGGYDYNPQRKIDEVGVAIANAVSRQAATIPNLWIRTEESALWEPAPGNEGPWEDCDRFVFIDPVDETNAITRGNRVQSSGIAVYNRNGDLLTLGVISLVDDGMIFMERTDHDHIYAIPSKHPAAEASDEAAPLRIATLARRMYPLRHTPIFSGGNTWAQDSIGGYAALSMLNNSVDAVIDPVKGNPWFEFILWGPAAEAAGCIVSDPQGRPIDTAAIVRRAIAENPSDHFRVRFVMSRTPEIHQKIITLLNTKASVA